MEASLALRALPAGTRLERYVIRSVIAGGGFGITYMAEHDLLGKRYAIKEHFPEQFAVRDDKSTKIKATEARTFAWALDRFLQEARRLARCKHPSVVGVADVFEGNDTAYMVLEYEEGQSFNDWVLSLGRPPSQNDLDALLAPLLDALAHVHAQGLLHRDIAPDNIIVRADGSPCLIDFGAAREAVAERSRMISAVVKSGYSPPEQYTRVGKSQGPWSDIYSLAATFFLALSGKSPPEATERQIDDELRPLAQILGENHGYRSGFLSAIDAALRLKPIERPQSVEQLREMLLQEDKASELAVPRIFRSQDSPADAPRGVEESAGNRPGARRWVLISAALIAVAGGLSAGLAYVRWDASQRVRLEAEAKRRQEAQKTAEERARREQETKRREAEAKRRDEERSLAEKSAADEARRFAEGARLAFEAISKAELAEKQRREGKAKQAVAEVPPPTEVVRRTVKLIPEPSRPILACDYVAAAVGNQGRCLKQGEVFRDCPECPEMVVVPAGEFMMGSDERGNEKPVHKVMIAKPFAVGRFAVSRGEFAAFAREENHNTGNDCWIYKGKVVRNATGSSFRNPGFAQLDQHPVVCVSWDDAKAFIVRLSKSTGKPYRLLSEAEREYVARAGTLTPFWWSATISTSRANYDGSHAYGGTKGESRKATLPANAFEPNPWGLFNVHGNVWEWTEDCWHDSYHGAPADGTAWTLGECRRRTVRGGSWDNHPALLRSSHRGSAVRDSRLSTHGFRIARTLEQ